MNTRKASCRTPPRSTASRPTPTVVRARPVVLVSLGAFIDAGHIQRLLAVHLLDAGDPEVVASFDVDQLLDYRGRRPAMVFDTNRWVEYDDPTMLLHRLTDRDGQTYYLLAGAEPDYQWERVVEAVRELVKALGVDLTVSVHGIPMAVPHTRPLGMTAHATDPRSSPSRAAVRPGAGPGQLIGASSSCGSASPATTPSGSRSTCRTTSRGRVGRGRARRPQRRGRRHRPQPADDDLALRPA